MLLKTNHFVPIKMLAKKSIDKLEKEKTDWIWQTYHLIISVGFKTNKFNKIIFIKWKTRKNKPTVLYTFKLLVPSKILITTANYKVQGYRAE